MSDRRTELFTSILESRLSQMERDAMRTFDIAQMAGTDCIRGMGPVYARATAKWLRNTAELLEKAASND